MRPDYLCHLKWTITRRSALSLSLSTSRQQPNQKVNWWFHYPSALQFVPSTHFRFTRHLHFFSLPLSSILFSSFHRFDNKKFILPPFTCQIKAMAMSGFPFLTYAPPVAFFSRLSQCERVVHTSPSDPSSCFHVSRSPFSRPDLFSFLFYNS